MPDWEQLGGLMVARSLTLREQAKQRVTQDCLRVSYRRWASRAVSTTIETLHGLLSQRAQEYDEGLGLSFSVGAPTGLSGALPSTRFFSLRLAGDSVDVHGQWHAGSPPSVHLLLSRYRRGRAQRLVCVGGAWLAPKESPASAEVALYSFEQQALELSSESVAYRAARLLLTTAPAQQA